MGRGSRTGPLLGCRPWGLWEAGLGQPRPLSPETKERLQLPLPRQPAYFLPTPRSFVETKAAPDRLLVLNKTSFANKPKRCAWPCTCRGHRMGAQLMQGFPLLGKRAR